MSASQLSVTDPATEFANLFRNLRAHNSHDQQAFLPVFAKQIIGREMQAPEYKTIAVIYDRANKLTEYFVSLPEDEFDEELKSSTGGAISSLMGVFDNANFGQNYKSVVTSHIQTEYLVALNYASRVLRRRRPISIITEEHLKEADIRIANAISEVQNNPDLEDWAKQTLFIGLKDLRFAIDNYVILGQDELITSFLAIRNKCEAVSKGIAQRNSTPVRLRDLALAMIFISDVVCAVPNIVEKLPWWYNVTHGAIEAVSSDVLQLPPGDTNDVIQPEADEV